MGWWWVHLLCRGVLLVWIRVRQRAYCACSRCRWWLFEHFFSRLSFLFSLFSAGASYNWITVGQGPTALAVGAGGGCLDIFTLLYPFSSLSPSLWETARYRLKYYLKGPLNPKQPTNQPTFLCPFLWGTARYRLKYYLKGPLSLKQTNQPMCDRRQDVLTDM